MIFNEHKPIFLQIADLLSDRVLQKEYGEDERIPSVRELGGELGVNPNTVVRSYDHLQSNEVIYNKRGLGYFISPGARERILSIRRDDFTKDELPEFFNKMKTLGVSIDYIVEKYKEFNQN